MKEIRIEVNMILAGDVGGTKTLLGLFERRDPRPQPVVVHSFTTVDFADLSQVVSAFVAHNLTDGATIRAAAFGVAGPVLGDIASLTNVPFRIDARAISNSFG